MRTQTDSCLASAFCTAASCSYSDFTHIHLLTRLPVVRVHSSMRRCISTFRHTKGYLHTCIHTLLPVCMQPHPVHTTLPLSLCILALRCVSAIILTPLHTYFHVHAHTSLHVSGCALHCGRPRQSADSSPLPPVCEKHSEGKMGQALPANGEGAACCSQVAGVINRLVTGRMCGANWLEHYPQPAAWQLVERGVIWALSASALLCPEGRKMGPSSTVHSSSSDVWSVQNLTAHPGTLQEQAAPLFRWDRARKSLELPPMQLHFLTFNAM